MQDIQSLVKNMVKTLETTDIKQICNAYDIEVQGAEIYPLKGYFTNYRRIKIITYSYHLKPHEREIVIAHELGHALLHKELSHTFFHRYTKGNTAIIEKEANLFAMYYMLEKYKDEEYQLSYEEISNITGLSIDIIKNEMC